MCQTSEPYLDLVLGESTDGDDSSCELSVSMQENCSARRPSLGGRRMSRRRSSNSIMKTVTLDESISSLGTASRRNSSCRMPVSFDIVEIHEHPMILDESRNGPALTIDWKSTNTEVTTVQEFDCTKPADSKMRLLSTIDRVALLVRAGYSKDDLCDHFAEDHESKTSKLKDSYPKQPQQPQPPKVTSGQEQAPPPQKTVYYKMKSAAKKFKKQVAATRT